MYDLSRSFVKRRSYARPPLRAEPDPWVRPGSDPGVGDLWELDEPPKLLDAVVARPEAVENARDVHEGEVLRRLDQRAVAAPRPLLRRVAEAGLAGISGDVAERREQVSLGLDALGPEPAVDDMATQPVSCIEAGCVADIEVLHADRQRRVGGLDEQVIVRVEEGDADARPAKAGEGLGELGDEQHAVDLVLEEDARPHRVRPDVKETGQCVAFLAGHRPRVAGPNGRRQCPLEVGTHSLRGLTRV